MNREEGFDTMSRHRIVPAAVALIVALLGLPASRADAPPTFISYPSYDAKFDLATGKFSLVSSVVVYNISGQTFTDVTFKQTYPEGVTVKETYQREVGTAATGEQSAARQVTDNVSYARTKTYRNRQYVLLYNELELARRLNTITFPGVEIDYTDPDGAHQTAKLGENTYDLFIYSNVVGDLERFLNKYNKITFDFKDAVPERTEWEFAPIVASAQGKFPTGIIGTSPGEDDYNGHFRLRSGPPGDNIQVLVVYKATHKKDRIADREALLKQLHDYLRWCGEFDLAQDGLQVRQDKWKKYKEVWNVDGRWTDTIKDRLGEGPFLAKVFYSPREDVEYYVLGLAHGRALGPESSTPNPEKEAQLLKQLTSLIETFKSTIVPLSYERR